MYAPSFQILCSVDPKQIPRLSSCDEEIYNKFRQDFPDLPVAKLKEEDLKSEDAKKVTTYIIFLSCIYDMSNFSVNSVTVLFG